MPSENLSPDELHAIVFDDPDEVVMVGDAAGHGCGIAVARERDRVVEVHIQAVAVMPAARRGGLGRAVVEALEGWAFDHLDAEAVVVGRGEPFSLFPGVDVRATAALCLFEALGYEPAGVELTLAFPSRMRAPVPSGVEIRRAIDDTDAREVRDLAQRSWPEAVVAVDRAIEHATCHAALDNGTVIGFGCHSVDRLGWLGPLAIDHGHRNRGVGSALLSAIATDMMAAGHDTVEVACGEPIGFFAKRAGASVSRVFRTARLSRRARDARRA